MNLNYNINDLFPFLSLSLSSGSLSLEYTVTIPCRPASNCQEGFFACDSTGVQTCQPDYVEDGICKTQKVKNMCTLPANPSPAGKRVFVNNMKFVACKDHMKIKRLLKQDSNSEESRH